TPHCFFPAKFAIEAAYTIAVAVARTEIHLLAVDRGSRQHAVVDPESLTEISTRRRVLAAFPQFLTGVFVEADNATGGRGRALLNIAIANSEEHLIPRDDRLGPAGQVRPDFPELLSGLRVQTDQSCLAFLWIVPVHTAADEDSAFHDHGRGAD